MRQDKAPAFQFYAQDFLMGTINMSAEEVGGYIRLLCHQWDKGGIKNDDNFIKKVAGISKKALPAIKEKFVLHDDGLLKNERMEKVRKEQQEYRKQKSMAGIEGNKKRWGNTTETSHSDNFTVAHSSHNHRPSTSSPSSSSTPNINYINKRASEFLIEKSNEDIQYMLAHKYLELDKQVIFARLDEEYPPGYKFNNQNHLFNTFKRVADKLLKEKSCAKKEKKKLRPGEDRDGYGKLTIPPGA